MVCGFNNAKESISTGSSFFKKESSDEFDVDWKRYRGWGGSNYVLGVKFDEFWEERWKDLFGVKKRSDKPKFPISTQDPKAGSIRLLFFVGRKETHPHFNLIRNQISLELRKQSMNMSWGSLVKRKKDMRWVVMVHPT